MCGIFGSTILYSEEVVKEKLKVASYRGPDFSDFKRIDEKLIFGHNRLSVVDLDSRSNQPFLYQNLAIVFNGEIYNFSDLRKKLEDKNYTFTTSSDTEVICAMYLEYGENCVDFFIGMFSFVIYDKDNDQLFGARDRLGQKPFFYYINDGIFEFASNLKQIEINNNLTIDEQTCSNYFYFGYFVDPETPYKNVFKLKQGHSFNYNLSTKHFESKKYWTVDENRPKLTGSYEEVKLELKRLLLDSVAIRLQADVPVGLFLSGGVDSSLITSLAKEVKKEINTYSIKFSEKEFDESDESREIASFLKTNHHTFTCDLNNSKKLIQNFYKYYDEPFSDVSALPSMLLSAEVSKHVTVALTGDGADELFLGYERYKWMSNVNLIYKAPYFFRKFVSKILQLLPNYKLKMLAKGIGYKNIENLYFNLMTSFKTSYVKKEQSFDKNKRFLHYFKENSLLDACGLFDMDVYLNSDINTKVDRASMAYSLETRSPFMDNRVVEYSRLLPLKFKFKNGTLKFILKDILSDYIPKELFDRPKKGFGVPLESWLKSDLKPLVFECLDYFEQLKLTFIDYSKFKILVEEFYKNKANHSVEIWKMMMFVLWYKERNES